MWEHKCELRWVITYQVTLMVFRKFLDFPLCVKDYTLIFELSKWRLCLLNISRWFMCSKSSIGICRNSIFLLRLLYTLWSFKFFLEKSLLASLRFINLFNKHLLSPYYGPDPFLCSGNTLNPFCSYRAYIPVGIAIVIVMDNTESFFPARHSSKQFIPTISLNIQDL